MKIVTWTGISLLGIFLALFVIGAMDDAPRLDPLDDAHRYLCARSFASADVETEGPAACGERNYHLLKSGQVKHL